MPLEPSYIAELLAAAHGYAERGWPVHAIVDGKGRTLGSIDRDGVRWGSTTDHAVIDAWPADATARGLDIIAIGIPTGESSGLVTIDIDYADEWERLRASAGAAVPATAAFATGRGVQLVYEWPGVPITTGANVLGAGLDVRGDGGQFVAPPSRHASGRRYEWLNDRAPASMPGWLLERLTRPHSAPSDDPGGDTRQAGTAPLTALIERWQAEPPVTGERNARSFALAAQLIATHREAPDIAWTLYAYLTTPLLGDGFTATERRRTFRSALDMDARNHGTSDDAGPRLTLTRLDSVTMRRPRWLWAGRLPAGALSLIAGREGVGKSTLTYDVASAITRGALPGEYEGVARAVIIVATEDSYESTILPRLTVAGANLTHVYRVDSVDAGGGLTMPADVGALCDLAHSVGAVLGIMDPLLSRLGKLDTHKDAEVRTALEPLTAAAAGAGMAVAGLVHVNKTATDDPNTSIMGSRAFTAVARSVLYALYDPDDETGEHRLLAHTKCNLGRLAVTLGYTIGEVIAGRDPDDNKPIPASKVTWGDEDARSGRELLAAANAGKRGAKRQSARDWLEDWFMEHGDTEKPDVIDAGVTAGFAVRTLERAFAELGGKAETFGRRRDQPALWRLS